MWFLIFTHTKLKKRKKKIKCKNNQNNAYKDMHDAQIHDKLEDRFATNTHRCQDFFHRYISA